MIFIIIRQATLIIKVTMRKTHKISAKAVCEVEISARRIFAFSTMAGMPLSRGRFLEALEAQLHYAEGKSPLYVEVLRSLINEISRETPAWFIRLEAAWQGRRFGPYYEAPLLLLAALHREALAGRAPDLGREYPSCGGAASRPGAAVLEYLRGAPEAFFSNLAAARLQTNEAGRSIAWLLTACVGFLSRGTPFHLVDLGTSAGLTLVGDYLPRDCALLTADGAPAAEPPRWADMPYPVLSRSGLDARPLRLAVPQDRLWLQACLWPDDAARRDRLDRAIELFLRLERETAGPKLFEADFAAMPDWIAEHRRPHPEEGLLVVNTQATDFLDDAGYAALDAGLSRALKPWGDRAFWVELEFPRAPSPAGGGRGAGVRADNKHELTVHRWKDGAWQRRTLGETAAHPRELRLAAGWDFLAPATPPAPPRITREERPRALEPGLYRFPGGSTDA